ncbi:MAG: glycosyl transferase family 2 [Chloroflexi bacterium B3_Chlor]|nr:MAG: glycosyl transferase family 2 [Chloroflexi bacterium B3_Chlor]
MIEVSIVVPAYNAGGTIDACLTGLLTQSVPREGYEVIVVDDGSGDETREIVGKHDVRLIDQPHQGPAVARNRGVAEARGEIVLFTDADCVPTEDWIAEMVRPFDDPEVVGVKGVYLTQQSGIVPRFVQCEYEERYDRMARRRRIDFVDTYAAGYRRSVFVAEGGFDVRYPNASVEDQEFSFRLAERGYRMVFNPQAAVYHRHPRTLGTYLKRKFNIGYWKVMVLQRHPQKAVRDSHTPQSLKIQMGVVFLLIPVVALALLRGLMLPALVAVIFFLVSVVPFAAKTLLKDPLVGVVSPLLLFVRSVALILGVMKGSWDFLFHRKVATRDA